MIIYLDLIFFINFIYDLLLLLTVSLILKRRRKFIYYIISAIIGGLSIFTLFLDFNRIILLVIKILISIIMCLISYGFVSIVYTFNNILYLYMCSVILAGFLYFLNIEFSYEHLGILFVFKGFSINYLLLLIIAPIILFIYFKTSIKLKNTFNLYYDIDIFFDTFKITCLALFDNGNSLKDPISNKGIIIVSSKKLKGINNIRAPVYVPCNTVSGSSLMRCYKPSYIVINNKKINNYLIGEANYKFHDGIEALLNVKLMEDNYV